MRNSGVINESLRLIKAHQVSPVEEVQQRLRHVRDRLGLPATMGGAGGGRPIRGPAAGAIRGPIRVPIRGPIKAIRGPTRIVLGCRSGQSDGQSGQSDGPSGSRAAVTCTYLITAMRTRESLRLIRTHQGSSRLIKAHQVSPARTSSRRCARGNPSTRSDRGRDRPCRPA
eukprot:5865539-Prymnesium_polylepis.1